MSTCAASKLRGGSVSGHFRRHFLDARREGAERIRLVRAGAERRGRYFGRAHLSGLFPRRPLLARRIIGGLLPARGAVRVRGQLCGNQPLRWARPKYSRAALRRPRRDRFGSCLDETNSLGSSSTRVEEASSKQHQFAPKRSGVETLIPAQVVGLAVVGMFVCALARARGRAALCRNQSFEGAPFRGKLMLFRQRFPDARRGGTERVRLVRAGAESVTTRPT